MPTNAKRGNLFLLKLGTTFDSVTFSTVAALRATSLTLNKAVVDITNKDSSGWQEVLPGGGVKSASISAGGVYSNDASQALMISAFNATTHWVGQIVDEDGAIWSGDWNIDSLAFSGDANGEQTFELSMSSAGSLTYTTV
tara:strand:+ start:4745 stop:5164 length:420 start_codon:yes stop_codon:yes gene_type:complete